VGSDGLERDEQEEDLPVELVYSVDLTLSGSERVGNCAMKKPLRELWMRTDDVLAESLEAVAKGLPASEKEQAAIWRRMAKTLRESKSTKKVLVREFAVDAKDDL
jgi:hypothetical protein